MKKILENDLPNPETVISGLREETTDQQLDFKIDLSQTTKVRTIPLPATGFLREKQIIGDPNADPPIPPIIPISNSLWWNGIKKGLYPCPVKLSARTSAWRVEDILTLIEKINERGYLCLSR